MPSTDQLGVYLNNHLAGANAGVEMARQLQSEMAGEPEAALLGPIGDEIAEDIEALRRIMELLGVAQNPLKQAVGWVAEKAHRLGVAAHLGYGRDLARMLTAESLSMGVEGKLCLWVALIEVVPSHPKLVDVDLLGLVERAREQRRRIEAVRLATARRAFA